MQIKGLGIGKEFFTKFIESNCYYVDKTPLIKAVFQKDQHKVLQITRPRLFGKTLTMTTFYEFLRLNPKDPNNSEDTSYQELLFKNTKIYEDKEFCQEYMGKFPVILISLHHVLGNTYNLAYIELSYVINHLISSNFKYLLSSDRLDDDQKLMLLKLGDYEYFSKGWFRRSEDEKVHEKRNVDPIETTQENLLNSLRFLTECLSKHHGVNPILLIDGYDVPINEASHNGFYDQIIPVIGDLFNKTLNSNPYLKKAVLTGYLNSANEILFKGIDSLHVNSVVDKDSPEISKGIGFTKDETLEILKYYKLEKFSDMVTKNYGGYYYGKEPIFFPWNIINFCSRNYRNVGKYDDEIIAYDHWIDTSANDVIDEYLEYIKPQDIEKLQALVDGNRITSVVRPSIRYISDLRNYSIEDFLTLLLYAGYLTSDPQSIKNIKTDKNVNSDIECELYIPNEEIIDCFRSKILHFHKYNSEIKDFSSKLAQSLFNGNSMSVEKYINKLLSKYIAIRDISAKDTKENYYYGFLNDVLADYASFIEQQKTNLKIGDGYIDIILRSRINKALAIIELKEIDNKTQPEVLKAEEALKQIKENNYAGEFLSNLDIRDIYIYGICFYQKECSVVVEKLK